ncbi:hypothetical protein ACX0G9_06190 [Flavitalea flava]
MKKYLLMTVLTLLLFACKNKKVSLAENDEKVDVSDFVEFFQPLKLPYLVSDTLLRRKENDSVIINNNLFSRFIPDTVLTRYFGKEIKPRLFAAGKVVVPDHETYLFVKASTASRKALFILGLDKKNKFVVSKPLIYLDNEAGISGQAGMDSKYTISITHQRKTTGGQVYFRKDTYVFNEAGVFTLIMTESNEASNKPVPVYNPIDTLPRKHKFTGDYMQDKRNFITVRDGKDNSRLLVFVHFEKDESSCKGELKGEAKLISANVARYRANGDPCTVDFSFGTTGVTMKELEGCGNHRDIKCFFEGYYGKRKELKTKPAHKPGPGKSK